MGVNSYLSLILAALFTLFDCIALAKRSSSNASGIHKDFRAPIHYLLERDLMRNYNNKLIPRRYTTSPVSVYFSIGLYQIIEVVS